MKTKILLAALLLTMGCCASTADSGADPKAYTDIVLLDQFRDDDYRHSGRDPSVSLFEIKGHEYIVVLDALSDGGVAITHAASCTKGPH